MKERLATPAIQPDRLGDIMRELFCADQEHEAVTILVDLTDAELAAVRYDAEENLADSILHDETEAASFFGYLRALVDSAIWTRRLLVN
ncbi:MAG TPA: hypothetical protein VGM43_18585 [Bryobacteraceae bacterium]|jgi:hypothetical protein